jgi:hypothetical protein
MSGRGQPPERVPTLTEVVDPPPGVPEWSPATPGAQPAGPQDGVLSAAVPAAPLPVLNQVLDPMPGPAHDEVVARRVLADIQAHIDRVLESRIRSALEPALEALAAQVIADTRRELASTLRDGLARALAQEAARHRAEPGPR